MAVSLRVPGFRFSKLDSHELTAETAAFKFQLRLGHRPSRSDHPHHTAARAWLEQALVDANQGAALKLQPMVIASFLRLVTHPKIFVHPTPVSEALRFIDALLAAPSVERPELGAEWPVLRKLCIDQSLAANDIPDAWLAAAAIHQGEHVASFDGDFKRLLPRAQFTLLSA